MSSCLMDDILVTGTDDCQHLQKLEEVFKSLPIAGFRIHEETCVFLAPLVVYLDRRIDRHVSYSDETERPVYFALRSLSLAEKNYF